MTQIAAAGWTNCGRARAGTVHCWGANDGQLGDVQGSSIVDPVQIPSISDAKTVAVGGGHACAYTDGGEVFCWGRNDDGQLGDGTNIASDTPVLVSVSFGLGNYRYDEPMLAIDGNATCAAGTPPKCWGSNFGGRLGDGTVMDRNTPTSVSGVNEALHVSLANGFGCASDGHSTVQCWGQGYGELGSPMTVSGIPGIWFIRSAASFTCAAKRTEGAICWGRNREGQLGNSSAGPSSAVPVEVEGLESVDLRDVSTGTLHACAIGGGRVWCWGDGTSGQLGGSPSSVTPVEIEWLQ